MGGIRIASDSVLNEVEIIQKNGMSMMTAPAVNTTYNRERPSPRCRPCVIPPRSRRASPDTAIGTRRYPIAPHAATPVVALPQGMYHPCVAGRLEVIAGCMFSGKTEELLRRVERARIGRKHVLLVKPALETRYAPEEVVAHHGRRLPCFRVPQDPSVDALHEAAGWELELADMVAFDEGNFFGRGFPSLCEELVQAGKRVIVAGLDLNFRGEPFGPMPVLLAQADEVLKLSAVCVVCGSSATRTQRLVNGVPAEGGPEILVGGLESYEARCRDHFVPPGH